MLHTTPNKKGNVHIQPNVQLHCIHTLSFNVVEPAILTNLAVSARRLLMYVHVVQVILTKLVGMRTYLFKESCLNRMPQLACACQ